MSRESETYTEVVNQAREIYIQKLINNGIITQKIADDMADYSIVIHEKGFFGKAWDKFFGHENNSYNIAVVKILK